MSRAVICKKKAMLDDSLRTRAKQNTKLTHTFCEDLTTIKSPSRERCASTFIPRIAEGLNETAQARAITAITQDLGTFTVPIFQPLPLKELNERNMPKPDLLEELKDARKRYEKHGLKMLETLSVEFLLFPTCQVRVVRFYVSCLLLRPPASCLLPPAACLLLLLVLSSSSSPPRPPRPTATCDPQRSLPDLNHDHPLPVFPAGPQPRASPPSVPCRTSTTTASIHDQCSLPDLNREYPRQVFPAGPHVGKYAR